MRRGQARVRGRPRRVCALDRPQHCAPAGRPEGCTGGGSGGCQTRMLAGGRRRCLPMKSAAPCLLPQLTSYNFCVAMGEKGLVVDAILSKARGAGRGRAGRPPSCPHTAPAAAAQRLDIAPAPHTPLRPRPPCLCRTATSSRLAWVRPVAAAAAAACHCRRCCLSCCVPGRLPSLPPPAPATVFTRGIAGTAPLPARLHQGRRRQRDLPAPGTLGPRHLPVRQRAR